MASSPQGLANKLACVTLRAPRDSQSAVRAFYVRALGFQNYSEEKTDCAEQATAETVTETYCLADSKDSAAVRFEFDERTSELYSGRPSDIYWKIGLAVEDVDASVAALTRHTNSDRPNSPVTPKFSQHMGSISPAHQFRDVGFLTHIADPCGFPIELLQTTFEANVTGREARRVMSVMDPEAPLGQRSNVVMGQITTRTSDPERSKKFYTEVMGMQLLVVEPVRDKDRGLSFDLYFYGYATPATLQTRPSADPLALENREWLYQQKITTLEIQHITTGDRPWTVGGVDNRRFDQNARLAGFVSISVEIVDPVELRRISEHPSFEESTKEGLHGQLHDPDGLRIEVIDRTPSTAF